MGFTECKDLLGLFPLFYHTKIMGKMRVILKSRTLAEVGIPFFEMSPKQWRKKYSG